MVTTMLTRRVSSAKADARVGMAVCFVSACLIPVLSIRRLAALDLTETELILGVLASMSLALLCTVAGLLLESKTKAA